MDKLYPYGRAGSEFAAGLPFEFVLLVLAVPIALGLYFLTKI